jgi:L-amino acid N-acyltransferase YncA
MTVIPMTVIPMTATHAPAVLAIYAAGIATGTATFETTVPPWETFEAGKLPGHSYVAVEGGTVLGWVACSPVSTRPAYAGVVEHSVYVDPPAAGRGVGRSLLVRLITSTEAAGIWTIQSGIFPGNTASLALHERCGFRTIGVREKIARRGPTWQDVILLERRSPVVL